jgi:formamidopyrimidine-DNA glycosylase
MPELPEVETTRRCLEPELLGRRIVDVEVRRDRMIRRQPHPAHFRDRLLSTRITELRRHGKFLLTDLSNDVVWVTHLGMSGRVAMADTGADEVPHTNVVVRLDSHREFRLVDPRTFGFVAAFTPEELTGATFGHLGADALTGLPSAKDFHALLGNRSAAIKALLLDQTVVAGLGNIYADEALHRAAISPLRPGSSLSVAEVRRLRSAIKATLTAGLKWGGTSLDDLAYLLPDGRAGEYVSRLRAYGREGERCGRCGGTITRVVLRQRSTHWCPGCQT